MSAAESPIHGRRNRSDPRLPVRARQLLRIRTLWLLPAAVASVVVAAMTALYIGSVIDPLAHLQGLPVAIVEQDGGARIGTHYVDIGSQLEDGLLTTPAVSNRLSLEVMTLAQAERAMGRGDLYATLVIPPDLTANLLNAAAPRVARSTPGVPQVLIMTNNRAGTTGASLASGILQPALAVTSRHIGRQLTYFVPVGKRTGATAVFLANPLTVTTTQFHPLPPNTALGLSAFYVALLTLMCGFLAATVVNSVVDSALGYATNEIGPRWRQRQPVAINRWQTLLIKWAIVAALTALLVAVMLVVAAWGFGMAAPHPGLLWAYTWLCAASVGIGTVALFAVAGSYGQLIALLVFVYAGLASAGGTVPVQALPSFLRVLSSVEPLRQVLAGTRSILYFNAQADAGLTRGFLAASLGLVVWIIIGTTIVTWYDRSRFYRLHPDLLAHVSHAVDEYKTTQAASVFESDSSPADAPPL